MSVLEALRVAWGGLTANRLRSGLTMLGILIGVGAVILLVAIGNGTSERVQQQIESLGSNLLVVYPAATASNGVSQGFASGSTLTMADVQALQNRQNAPDVVAAVPTTGGRAQLTYGDLNWASSFTGTTQDFPQVRDYQLAEGQFFTQAQVQDDAKVVVLGATVAEELFPTGQDPIGQTVYVNRQAFQVIGVFAAKGTSGLGNQDDFVAVPITTAWAYLLGGSQTNVQEIFVEASSAAAIQAAQAEITETLLETHHISNPTQADFQVLSQAQILSTASQTTQTLTVLLGAIAAISLVVGGIGIMNIMLVTVTERTREIGIRKAIGARRRDVLLQFLIESMFLSAVGGILGIVIGGLAALELPNLVTGLTTLVSGPSVLLAFGVSVGIGLFFGIYPANRAARLNPIDALRYE
jgi:putative ABC transport system permease protein